MGEKPCIRIGHLKIVDHLILGISSLHLKEQQACLDHSTIEPIAMPSWEQICEALAERRIDGAFINAPLAMDLFAKGVDLRMLMFAHRSGSIIVKSTDPTITTIADFKGKTVLIPSALSIQNMLLHRLLSTAALKSGAHDDPLVDVACEVVTPFLMPEMLESDSENDIAGFAVAEPYGTQALSKGMAKKLCLTQDLWKNHPCCTFVVHHQILEDHGAALAEIIALFSQTAQQIEDTITQKHPGKEEILDTAHTFLNTEKQVVENILSQSAICFDPPMLIPDKAALETIAKYMKDSMGVLNDTIDINTLVDDTFILNSIPEITIEN